MQVPCKTAPSDIPVNGQTSPPRLDSRPPHDNSGQCQDDQQEAAEAIDLAACGTGKQVVVQLKEPGNKPDAQGYRIAYIFSRVRIEQTVFAAARARKCYGDSLIRFLSATDPDGRVSGIEACRCGLQLIL